MKNMLARNLKTPIVSNIASPGTATMRERPNFSTLAHKTVRSLTVAVLCLLPMLRVSLHAATTILIATEVGLVKSTDGGATWSVIPVNVSSGLLSGQPVAYTVAVDPKTPSNWYITGKSNGAFGFYRSNDSGQTWTGTAFIAFQPSLIPGAVVFDAVAPSTIYMLGNTTSGNFIIKSTDYGVTWNKLKLPNTLGFPAVSWPDGSSPTALSADPKTAGVLYAVAAHYIFKSIDFGTTWTVLSTGVDTPEKNNQQAGAFPPLIRLDVDPSIGTTLYAASGQPSVGTDCKGTPAGGQCGLYKSTDGGLTWIQLGLQSPSADSLSIDPASGAIYAGGVLTGASGAVFKSTNGGTTFTPLKSQIGTRGPYVRVDPNNPSSIYAFDHLGFGLAGDVYYLSTDAGATWTSAATPHLCALNQTCLNHYVNTLYDLLLVPPPSGASGPPTISANGVVNGASFLPGFSQGSWITVKGANLAGTTRIWAAADFVGNNLPTLLDGVGVMVNGKAASVYYISPTQLNVLAPADAALGPVQVQVTYAGQTGNGMSATESSFSPAMFMFEPLGQKYVAAVRIDGQYIGPANLYSGLTVPARAGDVLQLYGTGFGPTNPGTTIGQTISGAPPTANKVTATIGDVPAPVQFAGLVYPGEYQFNIEVPAGLPPGDNLVVLTVGGVSTQPGAYLTVQ